MIFWGHDSTTPRLRATTTVLGASRKWSPVVHGAVDRTLHSYLAGPRKLHGGALGTKLVFLSDHLPVHDLYPSSSVVTFARLGAFLRHPPTQHAVLDIGGLTLHRLIGGLPNLKNATKLLLKLLDLKVAAPILLTHRLTELMSLGLALNAKSLLVLLLGCSLRELNIVSGDLLLALSNVLLVVFFNAGTLLIVFVQLFDFRIKHVLNLAFHVPELVRELGAVRLCSDGAELVRC